MKQDFIYTDERVLYRYESRILVDRDLLTIPKDRLAGKQVTFVYHNTKTGRESVKTFAWEQAISLAERRWIDRRYKNYEFIIY